MACCRSLQTKMAALKKQNLVTRTILLIAVLWTAANSEDQHSGDSNVVITQGHYPSHYCELTNVLFNTTDGVFYYQNQEKLHNKCEHIQDIWEFSHTPILDRSQCSEFYDKAHAFTIFYYYGSNYFHLHYDMMIPIYSEVYHEGFDSAEKQIFLPTVEVSRLQVRPQPINILVSGIHA